jgi:hypothetical protein
MHARTQECARLARSGLAATMCGKRVREHTLSLKAMPSPNGSPPPLTARNAGALWRCMQQSLSFSPVSPKLSLSVALTHTSTRSYAHAQAHREQCQDSHTSLTTVSGALPPTKRSEALPLVVPLPVVHHTAFHFQSVSQSVYIAILGSRLSCIFTKQRRHYSTLPGPEKFAREPPRVFFRT